VLLPSVFPGTNNDSLDDWAQKWLGKRR